MKAMHALPILAALALLAGAPSVAAQDYPTKPITLVVPFSPGGAVDTVARALGQKLSEQLGQPVVVENKPGASGNIGAQLVARAPHDGYTLLMAALTTYSMNAMLMQGQTGYNLAKDFSPVSIVGYLPLVLVTNPSVPASSVKELVALAKAKPGALAFGSAGNGSIEHVAAEMFKRQVGVDMLHVPYKGAAPAILDVVGGQIQAMFATAPTALSNMKGGRLNALLVGSPTRLALLPDVPTAREAGLAGFEAMSTYGVLAPAGTPTAVVARLNREIAHALQLPDIKARFQQLGIEIPPSMTPPEVTQRVDNELAKWAKVIKEENIHLE